MPLRIFKSRAYQLAAVPESAERMQLSGRRGESSQKMRSGLMGSAVFMAWASTSRHHLAFQSMIFSGHARSVFRSSEREEGLEGFGGVAFEVDFHGVTEREHAAIDVDLDAAGVADGGVELGVGE